jgi:hypothetical protein
VITLRIVVNTPVSGVIRRVPDIEEEDGEEEDECITDRDVSRLECLMPPRCLLLPENTFVLSLDAFVLSLDAIPLRVLALDEPGRDRLVSEDDDNGNGDDNVAKVRIDFVELRDRCAADEDDVEEEEEEDEVGADSAKESNASAFKICLSSHSAAFLDCASHEIHADLELVVGATAALVPAVVSDAI